MPGFPQPLVIAHRGDRAHFPENTPEAFQAALAAGAEGIELDLQLSRDGQAVLWHDADLAKAGRPGQRCCELESGELGLPRLDAVLEAFGGQTLLMLEIKAGESQPEPFLRRQLVESVIRAVRERQVEESVMILSFDFELLEYCAQVAPELPCVLDFEELPRFSDRYNFLSVLAPWIGILDPSLQAFGLPIATWTCNREEDVRRALDGGAKYILSDDPGWLKKVLHAA